jgi:hypothetical protein
VPFFLPGGHRCQSVLRVETRYLLFCSASATMTFWSGINIFAKLVGDHCNLIIPKSLRQPFLYALVPCFCLFTKHNHCDYSLAWGILILDSWFWTLPPCHLAKFTCIPGALHSPSCYGKQTMRASFSATESLRSVLKLIHCNLWLHWLIVPWFPILQECKCRDCSIFSEVVGEHI